MDALPRLLEPEALEEALGRPDVLIVDLSRPSTYAQAHIPGAIHMYYSQLTLGRRPAPGLLPSPEDLGARLSALGLRRDLHVVAYDDEGGGNASRLLWTLETIGHTRYSLLNGGLHAWANEAHPLEQTPNRPTESRFEVRGFGPAHIAIDDLLARLERSDIALLDSRSPGEFIGSQRYAARSGHIPGAVNIEWTRFMDQERNLRLLPAPAIKGLLADVGISPDKEVITYCQTHHRSSHTWMVLTSLGYPRVRGYAGAWSEWGNRGDTPIET
ncbi:MAG: sulfurtransferase [Gammaproteobacteria bacterium]